MAIRQISVFVENKEGALGHLLNVLAAAGVDMGNRIRDLFRA